MASATSPVEAPTFDRVPPDAAPIIESLRAFGYSLATAVADLVDNSVSAGARHIWIQFDWSGSDSAISVTDDGAGMDEPSLVNAMRLGSRNPLEVRAPHDLGRFGLGLKTASLSQCRRLTVRTKMAGAGAVTRCWDLDTIARTNEWRLLRGADAAAEPYLHPLEELERGTTILWQQLDRLTADQRADSDQQHQRFLAHIEDVRRHLGMVFHRLISGPGAVRLHVNRRPVPPWDPFLETYPATHRLPKEALRLGGARVGVRPFVLPHLSKLTATQHSEAAGPRGWNAHQGFYIYRNHRLLVAGDWLGFGWVKQEHYKLARVAIDIPNSLDHDWQIDVTKSRATPPAALRDDLRRIGERVRADAKRVYTHRGARLSPAADSQRTLLWEPMARHDRTFYRLNREHTLLRQVRSTCGNPEALDALLRLVEETVPLQHITIDNSEKPDRQPRPFEGEADARVREVMAQMYRSLRASGYGPVEARDRLRTHWPFELFPALLAALGDAPES